LTGAKNGVLSKAAAVAMMNNIPAIIAVFLYVFILTSVLFRYFYIRAVFQDIAGLAVQGLANRFQRGEPYCLHFARFQIGHVDV
jgi:hypothetical protein